MKNKIYEKTNKSLFFACVFLGIFLAFGITSLCFINNDAAVSGFPLVYLFAAICGVGLLGYVVCICISFAQKQGRAELELSFELLFITILFTALSPIALLMWIGENISDKISEKRAEKASNCGSNE